MTTQTPPPPAIVRASSWWWFDSDDVMNCNLALDIGYGSEDGTFTFLQTYSDPQNGETYSSNIQLSVGKYVVGLQVDPSTGLFNDDSKYVPYWSLNLVGDELPDASEWQPVEGATAKTVALWNQTLVSTNATGGDDWGAYVTSGTLLFQHVDHTDDVHFVELSEIDLRGAGLGGSI